MAKQFKSVADLIWGLFEGEAFKKRAIKTILKNRLMEKNSNRILKITKKLSA